VEKLRNERQASSCRKWGKDMICTGSFPRIGRLRAVLIYRPRRNMNFRGINAHGRAGAIESMAAFLYRCPTADLKRRNSS